MALVPDAEADCNHSGDVVYESMQLVEAQDGGKGTETVWTAVVEVLNVPVPDG